MDKDDCQIAGHCEEPVMKIVDKFKNEFHLRKSSSFQYQLTYNGGSLDAGQYNIQVHGVSPQAGLSKTSTIELSVCRYVYFQSTFLYEILAAYTRMRHSFRRKA